ncbi:tetratricopeptide repeat protein [Candidatus Woesearchaeota archaeon]|nr:tetratricopeptide repeat protein [Candidatus Woesearchaeota archaeon]
MTDELDSSPLSPAQKASWMISALAHAERGLKANLDDFDYFSDPLRYPSKTEDRERLKAKLTEGKDWDNLSTEERKEFYFGIIANATSRGVHLEGPTDGTFCGLVRVVEMALEEDPQEAAIYDTMAILYSASPNAREISLAVKLYRKAIELEPENDQTYCNLATFLDQKVGLFPVALEFLEKALEVEPDSVDAHYRIASLLHHRELDLAKAEHHYKEAIRLKPDIADFHEHLGLLYQQTGREREAQAEWKIAKELSK